MAAATPEPLWLERLSITTVSPGRSTWTRCCSTQAWNSAPLIAPSTQSGATKPVERIAPRKVVVSRASIRHSLHQTLAASTATIGARHVGLGPRFIDEHDSIGVEVQLVGRPLPARFDNIFPLL